MLFFLLQQGEIIGTVEAKDQDYALDWDISYEIVNNDVFEVTPDGSIKLLQKIDRENPPSNAVSDRIQLTVKVLKFDLQS